jgi:hypothetical protein
VTRALRAAALALSATACASRIFTDAGNGVKNDLAVRSVARLEAAYAESAHDGGLVLCGQVAIEPPHLAVLGTRGAERETRFAAYVSAAKLAGETPALSYASFYARYGSDCACIAKLEGVREVAVASPVGEPGVTLVNPAGVAPNDVTLEQQVLHVDALPGLNLRPLDLELGPRGGNAAYFALLPLGLAWDGTFGIVSLAVGTPLYVASEGIGWIASLVSTPQPAPKKPEPPPDPCAGIAWWYAPGGPH